MATRGQTRREVLGAAALFAAGCSTLRNAPRAPARWSWSGGVTPYTARVVARHEGDEDVTLAMAGRTFEPSSVADRGIHHFALDGLEPDTTYAYRIAGADGVAQEGRFRTFPEEVPASFSFVAGSCARTASEHRVFETILGHDPRVFLHLGDLHYENIGDDDVDRFRDAFDLVLGSGAQSQLYRSTPIAYVWDDHDFGRNNSDRTSRSKPAATAAYRQHVPCYPLGDRSAIHQAFTIGRVRFVMTDCRSERTPPNTPHRYRTMLGKRQKAWLKRELLDAKGRYPLVVLVSSVGWIGKSFDGDSWPGFPSERAELAIFMAEHGIDNVLMLSGDAHMLAIDDGANNTYSPTGGPNFPVFHVAALDQNGSTKGGPYTHGVEAGGGQFGLVTIDDRVHEVEVTLSGRDADDRELLVHRFVVPG